MESILADLIGEHGEHAYRILWAIAEGKRTASRWMNAGGNHGLEQVTVTPSITEQASAAQVLLERHLGKPSQTLTGNFTFADLTDDQLEARKKEIIARELGTKS